MCQKRKVIKIRCAGRSDASWPVRGMVRIRDKQATAFPHHPDRALRAGSARTLGHLAASPLGKPVTMLTCVGLVVDHSPPAVDIPARSPGPVVGAHRSLATGSNDRSGIRQGWFHGWLRSVSPRRHEQGTQPHPISVASYGVFTASPQQPPRPVNGRSRRDQVMHVRMSCSLQPSGAVAPAALISAPAAGTDSAASPAGRRRCPRYCSPTSR